MDFYKYPITQSLIRKFLYKGNEREFCPKQIYHTEWIRDIPQFINDPMMEGLFFETLCLGGSSEDRKFTDLPRKKLTQLQTAQNEKAEREGKKLPNIARKRMAQIRLEHQALVFKQLCVKYRVTIGPGVNTQIVIKVPWEENPNIIIEMHLDVFPTGIVGSKKDPKTNKIVDNYWNIILDLKATGNIHNTFGKYCYGDPENLDKIQGWMYHYGVRNINPDLNPEVIPLITPSVHSSIVNDEIRFLMWVFDYKKEEPENKFVEVKWNENGQNELFESIRKTIAIIEINEQMEWPTKPEYSFCSKCPISNCPDRTVVESI
jgi:hypothetical protein